MPTATSLQSDRAFSVHGLDEAPSRGQRVEAESFADAALAFLEGHHVDDDAEVALMVEDCETGERQCFRIDLATGETAPCD